MSTQKCTEIVLAARHSTRLTSMFVFFSDVFSEGTDVSDAESDSSEVENSKLTKNTEAQIAAVKDVYALLFASSKLESSAAQGMLKGAWSDLEPFTRLRFVCCFGFGSRNN